MKKIIALLLAMIFLFSFAACGDKGGKGEDATKAGGKDTTSPAASDTGIKFKQVVDEFALDADGHVWKISTVDESAMISDEKFDSINGGNGMYAALTSDGALWTWGNYPGNGSADKSEAPVKVLDGVKCVSVHSNNGFAILTDGSLYQWGYGNNFKKLRLDGDDKTDILTPTKVEYDAKFEKIYSGGNGVVAIDTDGNRYCWCGTNQIMGYSATQIDSGNTDDMIVNPFWLKPVQNDTAPKGDYYFGQSSTYIVDSNNTLYISGGKGSRLAPFDTEPSWKTFTKVRDNVVKVLYGTNGSLIVGADGNLWGWGSEHFGLCDASDTPVQITKDIKFVDASLYGYQACLAIDDAGHLYTFSASDKTPKLVEVK